MITNIFYCKPNIKCKTFESYRLKRRDELMNKVDKTECESVCNLTKEKVFEGETHKCNHSDNVKQLKKKTEENLQNIQACIESSLETTRNKIEIKNSSQSLKDFTEENINKEKISKKKVTHFVDDRYGNRKELSSIRKTKLRGKSSLDKNNYIFKEIRRDRFVFDNDCKMSKDKNYKNDKNLMKLDRDTICSLLENLKQKWQSLYRSYVSMPFSYPIEKKRIESAKIEKELLEVETLIDLLENNKNVYIKND